MKGVIPETKVRKRLSLIALLSHALLENNLPKILSLRALEKRLPRTQILLNIKLPLYISGLKKNEIILRNKLL
jgi:hypothetical protein